MSPSGTERTGPVKANASTAEKKEIKKPTVDTEKVSSLCKVASNQHPIDSENEAESTVH